MRCLPALAAFGLTIGLVLAAPGAEAAVNVAQAAIDSNPGYEIGTVNYTGSPSMSVNAYVGRIAMSGTDALNATAYWKSFCVDLFDDLGTGSFAVNTASVLNLSEPRLGQLEALASHADNYITDGASSAAMQMAIWEVLYETSGSYDVSNGVFNVSGIDQAAITDANTILGYVSTNSWTAPANYGFAVLTASGLQSQLLYGAEAQSALSTSAPLASTSTVPEPASWTMMLLGFGALGLIVRRRDTVLFKAGGTASAA